MRIMFRSLEQSLVKYTIPLAVLLSLLLAFNSAINTRLWDALNRSFPSAPDSRIVVVGINDASLKDYGRINEWPRELYAQALGTLTEAGALAIGVDILLNDPSRQDSALNQVFNRSNVVLASSLTDPSVVNTNWRSPIGVSALNISSDGIVRSFQSGFAAQSLANGTTIMLPSFARQLAVAAGQHVPITTEQRTLRYTSTASDHFNMIPFRDVVNGSIRYGDIQGKIVLIGLTAAGENNVLMRDITGQVVSGIQLQAQAVASLFKPDFSKLAFWVIVLVTVLLAVLVVLMRGLWGFALAFVALGLAVPFWLANMQFSGITFSLAAILGMGLVALERWWNLRNLGTRDPLTGFGNRAAFTRAVEQRWP